MLTNDQVRTLARASTWWAQFDGEMSSKPYDQRIRDRALDSLGKPDAETIVTSALAALASDDRNLRVAALRILRWHLGDRRVADAVLRATHDPARRVRRIAVQHCVLLLDRPDVVARLREIVDDPDETTKISGTALGALAASPMVGAPGSALQTMTDLLASDTYRERILLMLLQQPLDDATAPLFRDIARDGSKGEAVAATRVLCGYRMVNLAHVPEGDRKRVVDTYDPVDLSWVTTRGYTPAALYWVPVSS